MHSKSNQNIFKQVGLTKSSTNLADGPSQQKIILKYHQM